MSGINGKSYKLAQIHFYWGQSDSVGSEHTLNGVQYPGEIHLVNYESSFGSIQDVIGSGTDDALAVIGVFLATSVGNGDSSSRAIGEAFSRTDCNNRGMTQVSGAINIYSLLPIVAGQSNVIHQYVGSLTTATCKSVVWTV